MGFRHNLEAIMEAAADTATPTLPTRSAARGVLRLTTRVALMCMEWIVGGPIGLMLAGMADLAMAGERPHRARCDAKTSFAVLLRGAS